VGNAILWFIRLGIVSMSHKKRQSTLDISREYLGHYGGYFIAVLLLLSTLFWYITQTSVASNTITRLITIQEDAKIDKFAQVSVFLGVVSTFLCMEGIVLLRRLSTFSFPILFVCFFIIFFSLPDRSLAVNGNPTSLVGLSLVLATNLGISADFPTFFRHSRSWGDSVKALIVIQLGSILLGIFSLYFGSLILKSFEINQKLALAETNGLLYYAIILFIFFSVISANVANVYSASVGWEVLAPASLIGRKEYLILGLGLTIIFILFSKISLGGLLEFSDTSLVFLCLILVTGFLVSRWTKKPPSSFMKGAYFVAWVFATLSYLLHHYYFRQVPVIALGFSVILIVIMLSLLALKLRPSLEN